MQTDRPTPRYYQTAAVDGVFRQLEKHQSTMVVMATGLGKSVCFGRLPVRESRKRFLYLVHRDELLRQAQKHLMNNTGEMVGVEKANEYHCDERILVASVQSMRPKRLLRLQQEWGTPDYVVPDELHNYMAPTFKRAVQFFENAKVVGFTATPFRGDKQGLGQLCESVAYNMGMTDGIEQGWLCPPRGKLPRIESMDLSTIGTTAGDLNKKALSEEMLKHVETVVQVIMEHYGEAGRGPIFFPSKACANLAAERFNALKPGSALSLTDDTPPEERADILAACHEGRLQFLPNVQVATEGFDWPAANIVVMARPTKSLGLYTQMLGRGTRVLRPTIDRYREMGIEGPEQAYERRVVLSESEKPHFTVVDFVGNAGKHKIQNIIDLIGKDKSDAVKKKAKKILENADTDDPLDAIAMAEESLKELARKVTGRVKSRLQEFDFFGDVLKIKGGVESCKVAYGDVPATEKQQAMLREHRIEADNLSKRAATKAIGAIIKRQKLGLATPRQLMILSKHGWTNANITKATAALLVDFIARHGWKASPELTEKLLDYGESLRGVQQTGHGV